jgi:hypothetical protein
VRVTVTADHGYFGLWDWAWCGELSIALPLAATMPARERWHGWPSWTTAAFRVPDARRALRCPSPAAGTRRSPAVGASRWCERRSPDTDALPADGPLGGPWGLATVGAGVAALAMALRSIRRVSSRPRSETGDAGSRPIGVDRAR